MVPQAEQGNLLKNWQLRKQELSQAVYKQALMLQDAGEPGKLEDLLKSNSLYLVEVRHASFSAVCIIVCARPLSTTKQKCRGLYLARFAMYQQIKYRI
jgi:hypothetical protein